MLIIKCELIFVALHPNFAPNPKMGSLIFQKIFYYALNLIRKWVLGFKIHNTMAVTRLKRKAKRNQAVAKNRIATIKRLSLKVDIKRVDAEELKAEFAK